jgi:hypothetical protein
LYLPKQDNSVDDSLTLWKGRLSFKQYLPLKSLQFRLKTFELCESLSPYLSCYIFYTGNETILDSRFLFQKKKKTHAESSKKSNKAFCCSTNVIPCGWINYYNFPAMAKFLKWCNTLRGTVRENTKKLTASEMQKGETTAQHSGQWTSLCLGMARQETLSVFSTSQQLKFRRGEGGGERETEK